MAFLLNRELAEILFEGFYIQRWNDRLRPMPLVEADKNGNKMMLALFIGKHLEGNGTKIDWSRLADIGIYDALIKLALKDISSVFHTELRKDKDSYKSALIKIVSSQYNGIFSGTDFLKKFIEYIEEERDGKLTVEDHISRLSHNIAVKQEYKIIESMGYGSVFLDHEHGKDEIESNIDRPAKEIGVTEYIKSGEFGLIKQLIDRLRYQVRWSQTARMPPTNVLGHSFYVACATYFSNKSILSDQRTSNNFFAALMHDFLESYTRDIISPVKNSSKDFRRQVSEIESRMLNEKLLPKLSENYRSYFSLILSDEFTNRAKPDDSIVILSNENPELTAENSYIDGTIILASDYFAALLEAHQSIDLGISSHHLAGAVARLYAAFLPMKDNFAPGTNEIYDGFKAIYDSFITR